MSLLNRPSDGIHSVLTVIFKLLLAAGRMERDRLIEYCAPKGAINNEKTRQTLNRWIELGLFQETEDKKVSLHPDVRKDERDVQKLPAVARRIALAEQNNADFWADEGAKAADFTRSLCWLLAQDCWRIDFAGWENAQALIQKQLPGGLVLVQNDTRWSGLKAWAPFLGFGWAAKYPAAALVADPTDAIRDALPSVFGKRKRMKADEFIAALRETLPVLDGGIYRKEVEDKLRERTGPDAWQPPPEGQLSTTLSRALLRLQEEGLLTGNTAADAPSRVHLTGRGRSSLIKDGISEFTWTSAP